MHLSLLDVRCNPLGADALRAAAAQCRKVGARLRCVRFAALLPPALPPSLLPGSLLLPDPIAETSAAAHRPTLVRAHVTHILSMAPPASGSGRGVTPASLGPRFAAPLGLLGFSPTAAARAAAPAAIPTAAPTAAPAAAPASTLVTTEGLRRAFRAAALRHHPDKQPEAQREAAAARFAEVEQAYRVLCRAVQGSRRHLPTFDGVQYHFIECDLKGDLGTAAAGGAAASEAEEATEAAETARQLQAAVDFVEGAMRGGGTVLLHSAYASEARCAAAIVSTLAALLLSQVHLRPRASATPHLRTPAPPHLRTSAPASSHPRTSAPPHLRASAPPHLHTSAPLHLHSRRRLRPARVRATRRSPPWAL